MRLLEIVRARWEQLGRIELEVEVFRVQLLDLRLELPDRLLEMLRDLERERGFLLGTLQEIVDLVGHLNSKWGSQRKKDRQVHDMTGSSSHG